MPKKKQTTIKDWNQADCAIRKIGEKQIELQDLQGALTIAINEIKSQAEAEGAKIKKVIKNLQEDIELFCEDNKEEFIEDRTKKLNFGNISYRIVEKLNIKNIKATIAAIKKLCLTQYLRTKEEPDKEALRGLDDSMLLKIGVERKKTDKINIEPNYEEVKCEN